MQIAINTACYIGRETGYSLRPFAWGQARSATVAAFTGPQFADKLDELAAAIQSTGATAIELWSAHLSTAATPSMVAEARAILAAHGLRVAAYAASLRRPGLDNDELKRTFAVASALGVPLIAGGLHYAYANTVYTLCRQHGIKFAIENHPEHDPLEIVAQITGREDWFGTAVDTGWYRTNGADVGAALHILRDHIFHVHLKDVRAACLPHRTCALSEGIVGIPAVLATLQRFGYAGILSIEHEPAHHDPTAELRLSYERVEGWLAKMAAPEATR
jgi:sugar phosphate isomerase/epimerase